MKVALYARVSTTDQNCEMQLSDLRRMAESRGFQVVGEFVDRAVSGATDSRPELNRLMSDARRGRFKGVLVWRFDRFARSLKHLVTALKEFRTLGVEFLSHQEAVDTSTPAGRMLFQVIGAMAEFERETSASASSPACAKPRIEERSSGGLESPSRSTRPGDCATKACPIAPSPRSSGSP
jgi:DNA invertase Pin-like site-specific DNA recombinase